MGDGTGTHVKHAHKYTNTHTHAQSYQTGGAALKMREAADLWCAEQPSSICISKRDKWEKNIKKVMLETQESKNCLIPSQNTLVLCFRARLCKLFPQLKWINQLKVKYSSQFLSSQSEHKQLASWIWFTVCRPNSSPLIRARINWMNNCQVKT